MSSAAFNIDRGLILVDARLTLHDGRYGLKSDSKFDIHPVTDATLYPSRMWVNVLSLNLYCSATRIIIVISDWT